MSLISSFNPYAIAAGGVAVLLIAGGFYYQSTQIHHWHAKYDTTVITDAKILQNRDDTIATMVTAQKNQSVVTEKNVIKVVTVPGATQTIVKTIHDAPLPKDCGTPVLSQEEKNAF